MWKPISFSELLCFNNSNVLELPGRSVWSQPLLTSILLVCLLQLYATPPSPVSREHSQKQTSNTAWTSPPSQALLTGRWIDLTTWHSRCSPMPYAITCKLLFPFHRKEYISGAMVPPPPRLYVFKFTPHCQGGNLIQLWCPEVAGHWLALEEVIRVDSHDWILVAS
jgi:hypothetical protein